MAERRKVSGDEGKRSLRDKTRGKRENCESGSAEAGEALTIPECAVCLQICVHPAKLPCSHIFCFLCLKGLATQSRRCAMCRQEIPTDYVDHPDLLDVPNSAVKEAFEDGYQWFYEGRSGWWQYDERTSRELEVAYKSGHRACELLIVGQLYIADFDAMLQLRKSDLSRRRRIKRDLASIPIKGIAGLRLEEIPIVPEEPPEVYAPSTSQQTINSRCEAVQSSSQLLAQVNLFSSRDMSWRACVPNAHDSDEDERVAIDDVRSEDNKNDDFTELHVDVGTSENQEDINNEISNPQMLQFYEQDRREDDADSDDMLLPKLQNFSLG